MEATEELKGILGKIMPPRLEDAGLEDCALPPEAIKEAFAKAATAVRSIISASSDDDEEAEEGHCTLVGITAGVEDVPGSCANEKGGGWPDMTGDKVVVVGDEDEKADEVVVGGPPPAVADSEEKACVDGLQGLEIGEKNKDKMGNRPIDGDTDNADSDNSEGQETEAIPILTEGYV